MEFTRREVEIELPSRGLPYGDAIPEGKVKIVPWTTEEELEIVQESSNRNADQDSFIDRIVQKNTVFPPGFDYTTLLTSDRYYLLVSQRVESLFEHFNIRNVVCPVCEHVHKSGISVDLLDENYVTYLNPEEWKGDTITETLPKMQISITVTLQRLSHVRTIKNLLKKLAPDAQNPKKQAPVGDVNKLRGEKAKMALLIAKAIRITAINGVPAGLDKVHDVIASLKQFPYADNLFLEKMLLTSDSGVERRRMLECQDCGHEFERLIPFDDEFFRPKELVR